MKYTVSIESRLKEFWGVICLHNYYKDGVCRDLEFIPTPETELWLRNHYMIYKNLPFGLVIYYHKEYTPRAFKQLPPKSKLTFIIKTQNYSLVNFSQLPFSYEDDLYYFSNLERREEEIELDPPKVVHYYFRNTNIREKRKNILHSINHTKIGLKSPRQFIIFKDKNGEVLPSKYKDIAIRDVWNDEADGSGALYKKAIEKIRWKEVIAHVDEERDRIKAKDPLIGREELTNKLAAYEKKIIKGFNEDKTNGHQIDLGFGSEGRYTLHHGKEQISDFYVLDDLSGQNFGVLDIFLNEIAEDLKEKDHENYEAKVNYINFQSRPTFWRYNFINYPDSEVRAVKVVDEKGNLEFTEPRDSFVESVGTPSTIIESTTAIPLQERPKMAIWLERKAGPRKLKRMRLPSANANTIKPYKDGDDYKVYSDIFVYI